MSPNAPLMDPEDGLLKLPGETPGWIWAFTCRNPGCGCRTAHVLWAGGDRETLQERGRPVAEAWLGDGDYGEATLGQPGLVAFVIDLDTREIFAPDEDAPLPLESHPEVKGLVDRMDEELLDAFGRLWFRSRGLELPVSPSAGNARLELEAWQPGGFVVWEEAHADLRVDRYVIGEVVYQVGELYCVDSDCDCRRVTVNFIVAEPRGMPAPGHVSIDGDSATLHPDRAGERPSLVKLWDAFRARHPHYLERFAERGQIMHALAGRVVPARPRRKVGRNEPCPCGSGKEFKKCCATA